ncbi:MAG TPA: RDD family protein [Puia sp.]|nr:RDD family protein [Puia sp.]
MDNTPEIPETPRTPGTPEVPETPGTPEVPAEDPNILDDVHYTLYQASGGKRFANYIVDWIGFSLVWQFLFAELLGRALVLFNFPVENAAALYSVAYVAVFVTFGLLVGGLEAATGGKTLGKLITSTRAVNEDGSRLKPGRAFLRYLVRLVPFEAFSALGSPSYPWHDRWTKTIVIDERLTILPPED